MKEKFTVAVAGASGLVGRKMVEVLERRNFPVGELRLFASERSAGDAIEFRGREVTIENLAEAKPERMKVDFALFSAGGDRALRYAPQFAEMGAIVIDNSSAFRMNPDVPLVVPEVNGHMLNRRPPIGIIANPNCSTAQLVLVLHPLNHVAKIKRVVVSTYQSVSGAGQRAIDELQKQTTDLFSLREPQVEHLPQRIAFNCIPHIDVFMEDGYTKEEHKVIDESRKILEIPDLHVTATAVRVPVFYCHAESVNIEFERELDADIAREILARSPGVKVYDSPQEKKYPQQFELADQDDTFVGRIREDKSVKYGLDMWIVADNLLKGAALNAVQIAERIAPITGN